MVLIKILLISGLIFLILITGCNDKKSQNRDHLIYWSSNNSSEIAYANYIVDKWNSAHPDNLFLSQPVPEGRSE